ncbi:hypothetical protein M2350_000126 [Candidatus Fervidibacter sacchari]|uniref:4Fe-4S ferredoxin-type domain-containing protein n=1 Tax=Candidatus Fervidibacter sacchari TaxID=1448929 RepID=A0ABT2EIG9_9BACT|nr:hypothetical protein [Candidatus Fervidibacter sacchari]
MLLTFTLVTLIGLGIPIAVAINCWECPMLYGKKSGPDCRICCDQNCPPDQRNACKLGCYE